MISRNFAMAIGAVVFAAAVSLTQAQHGRSIGGIQIGVWLLLGALIGLGIRKLATRR